MAIAYSGPRGQSLLLQVKGVSGQGDQNIYLETIMKDINPLLQNSFILNLIKNTSTKDGRNAYVNSRYYYTIKSQHATKISDSTTAMITDPRTISTENIDVEVRQLAPVEYAKKFGGALRDLEIDGLENVASEKLASFIYQRWLTKQADAFNDCLYWANQVQTKIVGADATATTFEAGAHLVTATYTTSNQIYQDLTKAIQNFQRLGAYNSKQTWNQDIPYLNGVPKTDMLILMSDECASILLQTPGLFASDSGNELFRKLGLKNILGVECLITSQLPAGVNFMIITTGVHGSIGYEEIGNVSIKNIQGKMLPVLNTSAVMVNDPNWSGFYRIDYADAYKLGVILEDTIFVSAESTVTIPTAPLNPLG